MSDEVVLKVNGRNYGGWSTVRVQLTLEALAGTFSLSATDKWGGQRKPLPIRKGDECELAINGTTMIAGYVDRRAPTISADDHSIAIDGRDKAADLVDCTAPFGAYRKLSLLGAAKKLCDPFGVKVALQAGLTDAPVPTTFSVDPGDQAGIALGSLCEKAGLLPISDGRGGLLLARAGRERLATSLEYGVNFTRASASFDDSERYGLYRVLGAQKGSGNDAGARIRAEATDGAVRSSRVLTVKVDGDLSADRAKKRAAWEASVRAARGDSWSVTVDGWGAPWRRNVLVPVKAEPLEIDGDLLIVGLVFAKSLNEGTTTTLDLRRAESFQPDPAAKDGGANYWKEIVRGV